MINLYWGDCMKAMESMKDNQYDLAIVDPPYGIGRFGDRFDGHKKLNGWDKPPDILYFIELQRISKYQIIWGANNFPLPESEYFIIWDKMQTVENFASAEYAYTNIKKPAQVYRHSIHRLMHERIAGGGKIHPTQKPVQLYKWLLKNYAKEGDKILDTHGGSMSIALACHDMKFSLDLWELDEDYYNAGVKRYNQHIRQLTLF